MPNVFITHKQIHETYAGARRYGATSFLVQGRVDPSPIGVSNSVGLILSGLRHSKEEDFLLLDGDPLVSALAFRLWLDIHPVCKLLLSSIPEWVKIMDDIEEYTTVTIGRDELKKGIAGVFSE